MAQNFVSVQVTARMLSNMFKTIFSLACLVLVACAQQPAPILSVSSARSETVPTATRDPNSKLFAQATQTVQAFKRNPQCLSGAGVPLPSSLANEKFSDKIALELMHGREGFLVICTIEDIHLPWPMDQPYFAVIKLRENVPENVRYQATIEYKMVFAGLVGEDVQKGPFIVLTQERCYGCECHACPVPIWGGIFARREGQWVTIHQPSKITEYGNWGFVRVSSENEKLFRFGSGHYVVMIKDTYQQMGYSYSSIILISTVNGRLAQVLPGTSVAEDNRGACPDMSPCYEFDSEIRFMKGNNPDYPDLVIDTRGTGYNEKDVTRSTVYEFRNGRYVESRYQNK